jgi:hypothetical protein
VLVIELPWLNDINHPAQKRRIPSVLTKDDLEAGGTASLLDAMAFEN